MVQRLDQDRLVDGRRIERRSNEPDCRLPEDAVQHPVGVTIERSSGRILGVRSDARRIERSGVRHCNVTADASQKDRAISDNGVQVVSGWQTSLLYTSDAADDL